MSPLTISKEAQERLKNLKPDLASTNLPTSDDLASWKKIFQDRENLRKVNTTEIVNHYQANITYKKMGNATVIDIKPKGWIDNGKVLVYTHGGGYTQLSANSTLGGALEIANTTGTRALLT